MQDPKSSQNMRIMGYCQKNKLIHKLKWIVNIQEFSSFDKQTQVVFQLLSQHVLNYGTTFQELLKVQLCRIIVQIMIIFKLMRFLLIILAITTIASTLRLDRSQHMAITAAHAAQDEHLENIMEHLQSYNYNPYQSSSNYQGSSNNNYYPKASTASASTNTNGQTSINGVPLTTIRDNYLSKLPPGPTVDYQKASQMADFFATPMGATILQYFDQRTVQANGSKGLNYYGLSDRNYRFWLSIKIIADNDTNLYARSMTIDSSLFAEFIQKTNQSK